MVKKITSLKQWLVSIAAIIIITIGTVVLVAFAQGYNYDAFHNQIYKTGLVLIDSNPDNAQVSLNNKKIDKKTPYRYSGAPAGNLEVSLQKDQYRDWSKKSTVIPGEVTFVNYVLLLPDVLDQEQIGSDIVFSNIIQSENNQKTFALAKLPLSIFSISDDGDTKEIYSAVQSSDPANPIVDLYNIKVSNDGQRLLFDQKLANNTNQTITIDTSNLRVNNLTTEFGFVFSDIRFNPKNNSELFWLDSGVLKKVQINDKNISSNLIDSIFQLDVEEDRLLVVKTSTTTGQPVDLYSYDLSGGNENLLRQLEFDPKGYDILFVRSRYAEYLSVIYNSSSLAELVKNPYQKSDKVTPVKSIGLNVYKQTISPSNRFLIYNQNNTLRSVDLEFNQDDNYGASLADLQGWAWYDDYHLVIRQNNTLRILDYDGQNNYLLTPIKDIAGFGIQLNRKSILPLNSSGNLYNLSLTKK